MEIKRFVLPVFSLIFIAFIIFSVSCLKESYDKKPTLSVLMFHMVTEEMPDDEELNTLYITDAKLREYCEYFKGKYTIVSLDEAYDIIKNEKEVKNPNLLALTFDDGYDNNYFLAYPILRELDVKANINIIARYTDENYPGYLSWDMVREMSDSELIEFGSHTYDSHYYTEAADGISKPVLSAFLPGESESERKNRIFYDLQTADNMITEAIGKEINIIAYPYGVPPFDLNDGIGTEFGYDVRMLVRPGVNRTEDMFGKLKRFTVNGRQSPEDLDELMKRYNGLNFLETAK